MSEYAVVGSLQGIPPYKAGVIVNIPGFKVPV